MITNQKKDLTEETIQLLAKEIIEKLKPKPLVGKALEIAEKLWIEQLNVEKNKLLKIRHQTYGDGSCGLYSLFDDKVVIDGVTYYKCNSKEKREEVCTWLKKLYDSKEGGANLPPDIQKHLLTFLNTPKDLSLGEHKSLNNAIGSFYQNHLSKVKGKITVEDRKEFLADKKMFTEYLVYLKNPACDLYLAELLAAAQCFNKTVELYEPFGDVHSRMSPTIIATKFNDKIDQPVVTIWYDAKKKHYEKAEKKDTSTL